MSPQNYRVLKRLKQGPLTPMQALRECGTFRLAARIYEIRGQGVAICKRMKRVHGGAYVAEYYLPTIGVRK